MTAFLFSDVITCGFDTMLTRFSDARVFRSAKNRPVSNVKAVSPAARGPNAPAGGRIDDGAVSVTTPRLEIADVGVRAGALPMPTRPWRTGQAMPTPGTRVRVLAATSSWLGTGRGR